MNAALRAAPLGPDVTASIVDVASGDVLLARGESRPQQPASTLKTLTAVTALRALGTEKRLRTTVVAASRPGDLVLVGGGDATLTRTPAPASALPAGQAARPASLSELATRTAATLRASGTTSVTLAVDDSLFTGPRLAPGWPTTYVTSGVVSPVSALSADCGQGVGDLAGPRRGPRPGGRPLLRRPARGRRDHGRRIRHASYGARHGHRGGRGAEPDRWASWSSAC